MESVAEWYSRNLSAEVSKGRHEKTRQGYHNNQPPFGLKRDGKYIVPDPDELPGLRMAFEAYATGNYSFLAIAHLLNEHGYRSKTGRRFSKDTIREILRNQVYVGKIRYQETRHSSQGKRVFTAPVEWHDGQHESVISQELFDQCSNLRSKRYGTKVPPSKYQPYLLRGMVVCQYCLSHPIPDADFVSWGKMFCHNNRGHLYYRCGAKYFDHACPQQGVPQAIIDTQVLAALANLKPPADWQSRVLHTVSEILGEQSLEQRLEEIRRTIDRMDFRWDNGFITDKTDYLEKRLKLQQELERLTPVSDDLNTAIDLLSNFPDHLARCGDDIEKKHDLLRLIVERVYVEGDRVVALTLKADYHVALGQTGDESTSMEVDSTYVHQWALRDSNP